MELVIARLKVGLLCLAAALFLASAAQARETRTIDGSWRSTVFDAHEDGSTPGADRPYQAPDFDDRGWEAVSVPHNWQGYSYNRQVRNGARHGVAWYRKVVEIAPPGVDERIFLRFEGANSYATVWVNGRSVGKHDGGLTSFALDVTAAVRPGRNLIAVRIDNPAGITDLPWVSGDDQPENGFAEGSQPFGIFRPVHIERTSALRVRPFGVYAWGKPGEVTEQRAALSTRVEIENLSRRPRQFAVETALIDPEGRVVAATRRATLLPPGASGTVEGLLPAIPRPRLWSPDTPVLYTLRARLIEDGRAVVDELATPYGIRSVRIATDREGHRRLLVNGKPVFLRGVAEYEHLLGGSHAFSAEQVAARVAQVRAAGFNAFRDAHYPHNLRYGDAIARAGLMWWPQFSAHIWFDNPAFRANFRARLADWVRERRNNPAVFLWGLQNESRLPKVFVMEMVALIRELDPTASVERLIVTCNGGDGTDWNVPQNWSGTYGGDPAKFAEELAKQGLVGEYGGWRSLELHDEAPHHATPPTSEEHFARLMHLKARLAETVRDRAVGTFQWLLTTHENPGRPMRSDGTQIWDGVRELDHIGPANNKGLMTLWGEPLDAYYMYRALYVPASKAPMVYIVSHTWPDRWVAPGVKSGIEVYSNCDTVELFNDAARRLSLGRRSRDAEGRFVWNGVRITYDTLSATCLVRGQVRATDSIHLGNLPPAPGADPATSGPEVSASGVAGLHYAYRVNAGGPDYIDAAGQRWAGDAQDVPGASWGWRSWADAHPELDPALGSRRKTFDRILGTQDEALFRTFRYGRDRLSWRFRLPDGRYRVEFYFVEPWYGRAGVEARGWRVFDVAINDRVVLDDLDIFAEAGFNRALRKVVETDVRGGEMRIRFPEVKAGQAVISAIAIANLDGKRVRTAGDAGTDLVVLAGASGGAALRRFVDNGEPAYQGGEWRWTRLSHELLDSDALVPLQRGTDGQVRLRAKADVTLYRAVPENGGVPAGWVATGFTGTILAGKPAREAVDLAFVGLGVRRGNVVAVPAGDPILIRRTLVSPYAPGAFTFARDKGLHEAEDPKVERNNGTVATVARGYGGQGYVALGKGAASIAWPIEIGAAGRQQFLLRYLLREGDGRDAVLALIDSSGIEVASITLRLSPGQDWNEAVAETPTFVNAGDYRAVLRTANGQGLAVDSLRQR